MPTPRKHESHSARQASYVARIRSAQEQALRAKGLPPLPAPPSIPGTARWIAALRHARALLTQSQDEIDDYANDRSDAWQDTERAETLTAARDAIQECIDMIDQVELQ